MGHQGVVLCSAVNSWYEQGHMKRFSASCSNTTLCGRLYSDLWLLKSSTEAGVGHRHSSPCFARAVGNVVWYNCVWMKAGIVVCNCSLYNRTIGNSIFYSAGSGHFSVYLPLSLIFLVSFFPFPGYNVFTYRCLLALPGGAGPYKQLTTSRYCALC